MFLSFFYFLKAKGIKVSVHEWLTFQDAISNGFIKASLTSFYNLSKAVLLKKEEDFDKFDEAFLEYFDGIETEKDIPEEFLKWLSEDEIQRDLSDKKVLDKFIKSLEELHKMFDERIKEQKEKHSGGNYYIGTGGTSSFGRGGYNPAGIRVGGESRHRSALQIAAERKYQDFRNDKELNIRNFQVAFKKLRELGNRNDFLKTELNVEGTAKKTSESGGILKLDFEKPRKNTIKLILLIDSDGSMFMHRKIVNRLFQAVSKTDHFKDFKVFYFHNAIYEHLYKDPYCIRGDWVDTDFIMHKYGEDYKVIYVGDAEMAPSELLRPGGNVYIGLFNEIPGIDWMKKLKGFYKNSIWLNPVPEDSWDYAYGAQTISIIRSIFPMFPLTLEGLENGIKKLLKS